MVIRNNGEIQNYSLSNAFSLTPPPPARHWSYHIHTSKDCVQCHDVLSYSSIVLSYDLDSENWTVIRGSYHRMPEVKFSQPTLLLPVEVWPQRKSGYQGDLHNFAVVLQSTFVYSRAASSKWTKCLLKETSPKSLSRYFLPKTIRSSSIDFHS